LISTTSCRRRPHIRSFLGNRYRDVPRVWFERGRDHGGPEPRNTEGRSAANSVSGEDGRRSLGLPILRGRLVGNRSCACSGRLHGSPSATRFYDFPCGTIVEHGPPTYDHTASRMTRSHDFSWDTGDPYVHENVVATNQIPLSARSHGECRIRTKLSLDDLYSVLPGAHGRPAEQTQLLESNRPDRGEALNKFQQRFVLSQIDVPLFPQFRFPFIAQGRVVTS
jgi:hypothetical protein